MCNIIDADACNNFANHKPDYVHVHTWLKNGGVLVFSATKKLEEEFNKCNQNYRDYFQRLRQMGQVKIIDSVEVQKETNQFQKIVGKHDPHIVALAKVSGTKIVVSGGDKGLHKKFPQQISGGKIYQYASHEGLLRKAKCRPSSSKKLKKKRR